MVKVILKDRWLVVSFDESHETRSWAIYGGPRNITQKIVWYQVQKGELNLSVDAKEFAKNLFVQNDFENAVGLLTGAAVARYADIEKTSGDLIVRTISTVGMQNALRVGDSACRLQPIGTVNLLCVISASLAEEAFLEAMSIAVEARTVAVLESGVLSLESKLPATGTGTDCVVIAAPLKSIQPPIQYAGKHTRLGSLIGKSVLEAVNQGCYHITKVKN